MKISTLIAALLLACLPLINQDGNSFLVVVGIGLIFVVLGLEFFLFERKTSALTELSSFASTLRSIDYAVLALVGTCLIATAGSYFLRESLAGLSKYLVYALAYGAFALITIDRKTQFLLVGATLIGLFWSSFAGIDQILHGAEALATWEDPNTLPGDKLTRVYGLFLNPNLYGAYLVGLWVPCLALTRSFKQNKPAFLMLKVFLTILSLISVFLIVQTGSRGAWLALALQIFLSLLLIAPILPRTLFWTIATCIPLGSIALLYLKPALLNRILTIFSSYDHSSNSFRLHVWQATVDLIGENLWFGIGPGSKTFYLAYGIYMDSQYSALGAYSLVLELTAELGLIGLFCFLALIICLGSKAGGILSLQKQAIFQQGADPKDYLFTGSLVVALSGLLVTGLFDIVILRPQVLILVCLLMSLIRNLNATDG
ncbi:MAG: O-antigen ligase family protein [Candidatus Caenarcaniphilales bacterium]|nr:O-antigen ligase family protein [Candidatus Caenarcaniphilales bacterium]